MVSDTILRDLMTAKSKITDIAIYMHEYGKQLAQVNALEPLREILQSQRYGEKEI